MCITREFLRLRMVLFLYQFEYIWGDFQICINVPLNEYLIKLATIFPYAIRINKYKRIK